MSFLLDSMKENATPYTIGAAVLAVGSVATYFFMKSRAAAKRAAKLAAQKKGVVYLNILGRCTFLPNASPFCVKLETYLRLAGVKYEVVPDVQFSQKGKSPFIEYNGVEVADSSLAIQYMEKQPELKIDLDDHLTPAERGIAHAFKVMCDEEIYWGIVWSRWPMNDKVHEYVGEIIPVPSLMRRPVAALVTGNIVKQGKGHGIGRHSNEEVMAIVEKDITSISDFIGTKKFLMGDKPCSVDAAVFASLTAIMWCPFPSRLKSHAQQYKNLEEYCQRVKALAWKDWDDYIAPNGAKSFPSVFWKEKK